ncbi:hypothetical protein CDD80_6866 [Ophiocordyceps camponoti-rufipedis]|uniref:Presequence translocated-associated motor subunit PAM17 n=1 Tax=Ophiocordyceps camponoti-rufipedis TaxID=2004952 RepID=A0A2C5YNG7_9HYPO|nr:hypothetical protein CDD80_6866 [Ophiocordyceps camponoti-rufipedis]
MASALRTLALRRPPNPSLLCLTVRPHHGLRHGSLLSLKTLPLLRRLLSSEASQIKSSPPKPTVNTTAPNASNPSAFPPASDLSSTPLAKPSLDWNSFFLLRVRRRRIQVAFSLLGFGVCGFGGAFILSTGVAEPLVAQIPLDPFFTLGLLGAACAGMGWLAGPSVGAQVFYLFNWPFKSQMIRKESEFFARIKRNRVDPSNSSAGNPVPDFYGERIQSVTGYRQWLKDQRAFDRKKSANFV